MEKVFNKLVRDNIPEIIKADGRKPIIKKLSKEKFRDEALKKVIEEAKSFLMLETLETK